MHLQLLDGVFHIAGYKRNKEMISMAIEAGGDINRKNYDTDAFCLHIWVSRPHPAFLGSWSKL